MAFGKYTQDYNVRQRASSLSAQQMKGLESLCSKSTVI